MRNRNKIIAFLLLLLVACATMTPPQAARVTLNEARQKWVTYRSQVIMQHIFQQITDSDYQKFQETDRNFTKWYNLAKAALIAENMSEFDSAMQELETLLLIASAKGGKK